MIISKKMSAAPFANKERWEKVRNDFPDLKLPAYENRHNDNPTYEPVQK